MSFILGFLSQFKVYIAIGVVAIAAIAGAYIKGRGDGATAAEAEARKALVEQLTERNSINANVSRMSAADLCHELDGMWDGTDCQ